MNQNFYRSREDVNLRENAFPVAQITTKQMPVTRLLSRKFARKLCGGKKVSSSREFYGVIILM